MHSPAGRRPSLVNKMRFCCKRKLTLCVCECVRANIYLSVHLRSEHFRTHPDPMPALAQVACRVPSAPDHFLVTHQTCQQPLYFILLVLAGAAVFCKAAWRWGTCCEGTPPLRGELGFAFRGSGLSLRAGPPEGPVCGVWGLERLFLFARVCSVFWCFLVCGWHFGPLRLPQQRPASLRPCGAVQLPFSRQRKWGF